MEAIDGSMMMGDWNIWKLLYENYKLICLLKGNVRAETPFGGRVEVELIEEVVIVDVWESVLVIAPEPALAVPFDALATRKETLSQWTFKKQE